MSTINQSNAAIFISQGKIRGLSNVDIINLARCGELEYGVGPNAPRPDRQIVVKLVREALERAEYAAGAPLAVVKHLAAQRVKNASK